MKVRFSPALALAAALTVAGCQNPDGSTDWGSTLALGAGIGLAAGLVAASAGDSRHPPRRHGRSYEAGPRRYAGDPGYGRVWR